ncbi:SRPBCC family protein [Nocardia vinacea]|uniref:SRPBCC family protein n=1 Tax=Nocardia vinacea TaxID=96468 RepID=UPI0002DE5DC2|nr:SRPBCC family protein [Nocardia vinacea]
METMTIERVIAAPIDDVFDWLTNASNYTKARIVLRERLIRQGETAPYGLGAVRILTWGIGWFRERITGYDAPHEFSYLVERSVPASRHEGGRLSFTEVDGGTRVTWTTTAEARLPFASAWFTRVLAEPVILYSFGKVLDAAESALARANR